MIKTTKKLKNSPAKSEVAKVASTKTPATTTLVAAVKPEPATRPAPAAAPIILARKAATPRVQLEFVKPEAKHVFVAGSFNEWKPEQTPLTPDGKGRWVGDLSVKPGRHEYLFVVDGQWMPDPNAKEAVANPFGGRNSVLLVSE